jgi:nucleoside-diphosphate-sugar epimerase
VEGVEEECVMRKIALVVGSSGYIGKRVVEQLKDGGFETVGMDVTRSKTTDRVGDVRFSDEIHKAIAEVKPNVLVHLAYMLTGETATDPQKAMRLNLTGTNNVFDAAAFYKVPRVLFASSTSVYGDQKNYGDVYLDENTEGRAATLYGWMKQFGEVTAAHYQGISETRFISVRISSLYGRGRLGGRFNPIGDVISAKEEDDPIVIRVPSQHVATFIHVDEVAQVFKTLASAENPRYDVYNTGGVSLSMGELAQIAQKVFDRPVVCDEKGDDFSHAGLIDWSRLKNEFSIERNSLMHNLATEKEYVKSGA